MGGAVSRLCLLKYEFSGGFVSELNECTVEVIFEDGSLLRLGAQWRTVVVGDRPWID
jgi:hypothetical protein